MSLCKRKCWYSNKHLHFIKRVVPLFVNVRHFQRPGLNYKIYHNIVLQTRKILGKHSSLLFDCVTFTEKSFMTLTFKVKLLTQFLSFKIRGERFFENGYSSEL